MILCKSSFLSIINLIFNDLIIIIIIKCEIHLFKNLFVSHTNIVHCKICQGEYVNNINLYYICQHIDLCIKYVNLCIKCTPWPCHFTLKDI